MYLKFNAETGTLWVYDAQGNPVREAAGADLTLPTSEQFAGGGAAGEEAPVAPPETKYPAPIHKAALAPAEQDAFNVFNKWAKEQEGVEVPTLTEEDARYARYYSLAYGTDYPTALKLMAFYKSHLGELDNLPPPAVAPSFAKVHGQASLVSGTAFDVWQLLQRGGLAAPVGGIKLPEGAEQLP